MQFKKEIFTPTFKICLRDELTYIIRYKVNVCKAELKTAV